MKEKLFKAKDFYEKYDTRIGLGLMALGFIVDSLTLQRIDLLFENLILAGYLTIALVTILVLNAYYAGKLKFLDAVHSYLPLPMQYAFGGLFSAYIVFYSRSASFVSSWPFLIMLVGILIGNEFAKTRYQRFTFNITIFYIALFSFFIFFIPILTKSIGGGTFALSGLISLVAISLVLFLLRQISKEYFNTSKKSVVGAVLAVFFIFNFLYLFKIIPPLPLALKTAGVYHSVVSTGGKYYLEKEPTPWYWPFNETSTTFHREGREPVYVFTSVFAPTSLKTKIYHQWYYKGEDGWVKRDRLSFSIVGGRDGGYRGYSRKSFVEDGKWRVDVVTETDQLLGRIKFKVKEADKEVDIQDVVL